MCALLALQKTSVTLGNRGDATEPGTSSRWFVACQVASVVDVDYDAAGKVRSLRQRSVSGGNGDEAEWDNNASVSTKSFSIVAADHG